MMAASKSTGDGAACIAIPAKTAPLPSLAGQEDRQADESLIPCASAVPFSVARLLKFRQTLHNAPIAYVRIPHKGVAN